MDRSEKVFKKVSDLYLAKSGRNMGKWMWHNHVQWVADKAKELAKKYGADLEKVYCSALLHDLADSQFERGDENFDTWSENKGKEILAQVGFDQGDIEEILETIVRPHSCRKGNLPTTLEGKVLATADALFHLQTGFFAMLCYKQKPEYIKTYEEWQKWFNGKIERDFGIKIFFEEDKIEAKDDYDALYKVFGNKTLNSKEE